MTVTLEASHCQRLQTVLELEVENGSWRYGRVVPQGRVAVPDPCLQFVRLCAYLERFPTLTLQIQGLEKRLGVESARCSPDDLG